MEGTLKGLGGECEINPFVPDLQRLRKRNYTLRNQGKYMPLLE